ncbi:hypothetical protein GCM10011390_37770 [Aureimonas endophytica]|uniref:Uncharacterized protein n=1 Tax=Aureimonas endophytica TaxID=2027858 RepID=A0A917E8P3_9HYPH|nr:hypothetical protein GCM10011390_37770 [Aureimonas endophytica]
MRIPVDATKQVKAVAVSSTLSKLTNEVLAAVDRAVAGTTIEPIAMQRVRGEERLRAFQEATNLTIDEKSAAVDRINKENSDLDTKLASFKGTQAYNLFISEFGKYGLK